MVCRDHGHPQEESGSDRRGRNQCGEPQMRDTRLIGSFREEPGIFPGWHMNKAHGVTVALDGTVEDGKIRFLVDMS